jgi:hypothetical protein
MARPIKETPVLKGQDAVKFNEALEKAKSEIILPATKERIQINYQALKAIAKF